LRSGLRQQGGASKKRSAIHADQVITIRVRLRR
jgi:hypothetical protein